MYIILLKYKFVTHNQSSVHHCIKLSINHAVNISNHCIVITSRSLEFGKIKLIRNIKQCVFIRFCFHNISGTV